MAPFVVPSPKSVLDDMRQIKSEKTRRPAAEYPAACVESTQWNVKAASLAPRAEQRCSREGGGCVVKRRPYRTEVDVTRGAMRRELSALACLLAFAINLFASLAMGTQPAQIPGLTSTESGNQIVLCTPAGRLVLDKSGNLVPDEEGNGDHKLAQCVFCLPAFSADSIAAPFVDLLEPQRLVTEAEASTAPLLNVLHFHARAHPARGPPALLT